VEVRGQRVEIAEVEAALLDLPEIEETVVVGRKDDPGTTRLVAYLVPAGPPAPIPRIRNRLLQRLPDYMVPALFVWLDALPLNPSGKVDRRGLPDPDRSRPDLGHAYVAPRSPLEQFVAAIWAEVLELERVGVHDDLLDLGGDSLRATRILARIRDGLGADLPLSDLFVAPTVAEQAAALARCGVETGGGRP
jgi:aryl carrier-like protein